MLGSVCTVRNVFVAEGDFPIIHLCEFGVCGHCSGDGVVAETVADRDEDLGIPGDEEEDVVDFDGFVEVEERKTLDEGFSKSAEDSWVEGV